MQNATDINAEMQSRIIAEQAVVGKQKAKVLELTKDVTELKQELETSRTNIEVTLSKISQISHDFM